MEQCQYIFKNKYPCFDDIKVSTKTFIVMTNITINIEKLYNFLPITSYTVVPKKRERKKKTIEKNPNNDMRDGNIVTIDMKDKHRGVLLKTKKKKKSDGTIEYFRNSVTIVMYIENKFINFKISRNGKFQVTGCKFDHHAEQCVLEIWNLIKDSDVYEMDESVFKATFVPAMRNIDFSLGFKLDRERLDEYFNIETDHRSLLETSIGYTGVNIKFRVKKSILDLPLKQIVCGESVETRIVPYEYYLNNSSKKERKKKLEMERYNTFLVFHSGKVIMSSMCKEFARDVYYEFVEIIDKNRDIFEEKLDI